MKKKSKSLSTASIILFFLSIAAVAGGLVYFFSSSYSYYSSQYWDCYDQWYNCIQLRSSYSTSSYWYAFYDVMVDEWQGLMNTWKGYMTEIEIVTNLCILAGAILFVVSIILRIASSVNKKKENKLLAMQPQVTYGYVPVQGAPGQYQQVVIAPQVAPNGYVVNPVVPQAAPNGYVVAPVPQATPNGFVPPVAPAAPMAPPVAPNGTRPVAPPPVKPDEASPVESTTANETVSVEE